MEPWGAPGFQKYKSNSNLLVRFFHVFIQDSLKFTVSLHMSSRSAQNSFHHGNRSHVCSAGANSTGMTLISIASIFMLSGWLSARGWVRVGGGGDEGRRSAGTTS